MADPTAITPTDTPAVPLMDDAFQVHMLTEDGKKKALAIAKAFNDCLFSTKLYVPDGRELAIVRTKLEEACFFAKKGMAKFNSQP